MYHQNFFNESKWEFHISLVDTMYSALYYSKGTLSYLFTGVEHTPLTYFTKEGPHIFKPVQF